MDGGVPRPPSCGAYISQLLRFARVCGRVGGFGARGGRLTAELLKQGYRYRGLGGFFSKFYRRHYELISEFSVRLKSLLHQGLSEPEFYGDLVCGLGEIVGGAGFACLFRGIIIRIGYDLNGQQSACLMVSPIMVNGFAALFGCAPEDRASDSMMARPKAIHFSWLALRLLLGPPGLGWWSSFASDFRWCCCVC